MPASLTAASMLPHPPPREKTTTTATTKQMVMQRNIKPNPNTWAIPWIFHWGMG